jgi:hypothetical protein
MMKDLEEKDSKVCSFFRLYCFSCKKKTNCMHCLFIDSVFDI